MEHLPWDQMVEPAWDVFYLFDRNATWTERPEPVSASGDTFTGVETSWPRA